MLALTSCLPSQYLLGTPIVIVDGNRVKFSKVLFINCILERKLMLNILENIFYSDLFTFKIV